MDIPYVDIRDLLDPNGNGANSILLHLEEAKVDRSIEQVVLVYYQIGCALLVRKRDVIDGEGGITAILDHQLPINLEHFTEV